jgi:hypothetical protein
LALQEIAVKYILNRLVVGTSSNKFQMEVNPGFGDETVNITLKIPIPVEKIVISEERGDNEEEEEENEEKEVIVPEVMVPEKQFIEMEVQKLKCEVECPEGLIPVIIPRRKKSNVHDFQKALTALRSDHEQLTAASNIAHRAAGLAEQGVDTLKQLISSNKWDKSSKMSHAKFRWKWAIKRVITRNFTKAVRIRTGLLNHGDPISMMKMIVASSNKMDKIVKNGGKLPALKSQRKSADGIPVDENSPRTNERLAKSESLTVLPSEKKPRSNTIS